MPLNASIGGGLLRGLMFALGQGDLKEQRKLDKQALDIRSQENAARERAAALKAAQDAEAARQQTMELNPFRGTDDSVMGGLSPYIRHPDWNPSITPGDAPFKLDTQAGQKYYAEQMGKNADMRRGKDWEGFKNEQAVGNKFLEHNLDAAKGIPFPNRTALENFAITDSGPAAARRNQNMDIYQKSEQEKTAGQTTENALKKRQLEASIASGVTSLGGDIFSYNGETYIKQGSTSRKDMSGDNFILESSEGGLVPLKQAVGGGGGTQAPTPGSKGPISANPKLLDALLEKHNDDINAARAEAVSLGYELK